jgi:hypothetical protein
MIDDGRLLTLLATLGVAGAATLLQLQSEVVPVLQAPRRRNRHERHLRFEEERFVRPSSPVYKQSLVTSLSELERFPPGTRLRREAYGPGVAERFFTKDAQGVWSRDDGAVFEPRRFRRLLTDRTLYVVEPEGGS